MQKFGATKDRAVQNAEPKILFLQVVISGHGRKESLLPWGVIIGVPHTSFTTASKAILE